MQQEKFIIASKMDKTPLSVLMVTPDGAPTAEYRQLYYLDKE